MTDVSDRRRQPQGQSTGGQFATESRAESDVHLTAAGACDICTDDTEPGHKLCPICEESASRTSAPTPVVAPGLPDPARLAHMDPREVDGEMSLAMGRQTRAAQQVARVMHDVERASTLGPTPWGAAPHSPGEIVESAQQAADSGSTAAARALEKLHVARAELEARNQEVEAYDAEWRRRGRWSRAFLVTGSDGHVHSSMGCSTCNRGNQATSFQFMTEFSGRDEDQIVAAAGWRACTVCYPTAPVGDQTTLPTSMWSDDEKSKADARAEREAKKAARDADAIAKGLTADGSPLRVGWTARNRGGWDLDPQARQRFYVYRDREEHETFKTERSAVQWYVERKAWGVVDQSMVADMAPAFEAIEQALAAKRGTDVETVRAELAEKVQQKHRRNSR